MASSRTAASPSPRIAPSAVKYADRYPANGAGAQTLSPPQPSQGLIRDAISRVERLLEMTQGTTKHIANVADQTTGHVPETSEPTQATDYDPDGSGALLHQRLELLERALGELDRQSQRLSAL